MRVNFELNLPPVQPVQAAPQIDAVALIRLAQTLSSRAGKSPVRYLSLGGDAPRKRTGMRWNPSSLDGCAMKAVYKAAGAAPDPGYEVDPEDQTVFDRGTVIGAWVASYFRALEAHGVVSEVEGAVIDREERLATAPALSYGGFVDVVFRYEGHYYLIEVKSKDNEDALDRVTKPADPHLRQGNDYMAMTSIHAGGILYAAPVPRKRGQGQSLGFTYFNHEHSRELWGVTERRVASLERFIEKPDRMPPRTSNKFFECPSCPYRRQCDAGLSPAQAAAAARAARTAP